MTKVTKTNTVAIHVEV